MLKHSHNAILNTIPRNTQPQSYMLLLAEFAGMLTLELSSYLLEITNDAYTTLQSILIGCSTLSQEYCKLIGLYLKLMRKQR